MVINKSRSGATLHGIKMAAEDTPFVVSWPTNTKLIFKELPHDIRVYCIKCKNFMRDPHQSTCCFNHFCERCCKDMELKNSAQCPQCKLAFNAFRDGFCQKRIRGLVVQCIHKESGCDWLDKLEHLSAHLNYREKTDIYPTFRYQGCQYTEIRCKHIDCKHTYKKRKDLKDHEDSCEHRPHSCPYCIVYKGTFRNVEEHFQKCPQYDISCSNEGHPTNFSIKREKLQEHLDTECPFQPVDCNFKWAGCNDRPQRRDLDKHNASNEQKHLLLLTDACAELRKEVNETKQALKHLRVDRLHHTVHGTIPVVGNEYDPIRIDGDGVPVHFFSNNYGYKMSARYGKIRKIVGRSSHNLEFKIYQGNHKAMPDVKKIIVRTEKGRQITLSGDSLIKHACSDAEKQKIFATILDRGDVIYIIGVK